MPSQTQNKMQGWHKREYYIKKNDSDGRIKMKTKLFLVLTLLMAFSLLGAYSYEYYGAFQIKTSPKGADVNLEDIDLYLCSTPSPVYPVLMDEYVELREGIPGRTINVIITLEGYVPIRKSLFVPFLFDNQRDALRYPTVFNFRLTRDRTNTYYNTVVYYSYNYYRPRPIDYYYWPSFYWYPPPPGGYKPRPPGYVPPRPPFGSHGQGSHGGSGVNPPSGGGEQGGSHGGGSGYNPPLPPGGGSHGGGSGYTPPSGGGYTPPGSGGQGGGGYTPPKPPSGGGGGNSGGYNPPSPPSGGGGSSGGGYNPPSPPSGGGGSSGGSGYTPPSGNTKPSSGGSQSGSLQSSGSQRDTKSTPAPANDNEKEKSPMDVLRQATGRSRK